MAHKFNYLRIPDVCHADKKFQAMSVGLSDVSEGHGLDLSLHGRL